MRRSERGRRARRCFWEAIQALEGHHPKQAAMWAMTAVLLLAELGPNDIASVAEVLGEAESK